jgi:hypothetical protein
MKNYLLKHHKLILTTLLIAVAVFGFGGHVWAAWESIVQCWWNAAIEENGTGIFFMSLFLNFISWAWMIPAVLAGELMSNDLVYGQLVWLEHYFYQFWTLMRTIANFALVAIIIMVIIKIIRKPWEYMKLLGDYGSRILISGVLINMSWFLMWAAVDVSTVAIAWIWQVGSQFMTKELSLDNTKDPQSKKWVQGLIVAIPSKITINDCGCLVATTPKKDNPNKTRENLVEKRNNLAGPLIFLWAWVLKLQAYWIWYDCGDMASVKKSLSKNALKVILTTALAFMFVVPLIVLVAFNLFRLIYLRWWIIFSPLIVLVNLFADEAKIFNIDDKTKNMISRSTMFTGLLQPVFTSWALIIWMMLIVWVYDGLRFDQEVNGISKTMEGVTNTAATSQINIDSVGSVTMIDSLISDPTGTIGWWFGYLLLAVATCMVLWMLVKMSFTISKEWIWAWMPMNPVEMMDKMRSGFMMRAKLPNTWLWWPLDGASLSEAASLLDPTDKNNKIMNKIEEVGNGINKSSKEDAYSRMKTSLFGKMIWLNTEWDFGGVLKVEKLKSKDNDNKDFLPWNTATKAIFDEAKKLKSDSSNDYKSVPVAPNTKVYQTLEKWYEDWGKNAILSMWLKMKDKDWKTDVDLVLWDFAAEYDKESYLWWLVKYLAWGKQLEFSDGKAKNPSFSKAVLKNMDISGW